MLLLIAILTIAGFGFGATVAVVLGWIHGRHHRHALPVWASQTDRAGNYAGKP